MKKKKSSKTLWFVLIFLLLAAVGGYGYYQYFYLPTQQVEEGPSYQTAIARKGDIVLLASGSGTLIPAAELNLGFESGGTLSAILVEVGSEVEVGQVLAQLDDAELQEQLIMAQRNLRELVSPAVIAAAEKGVAQAQIDLVEAEDDLKLLISHTVYRTEKRLAEAEVALAEAQAAVESSPTEENEQKVAEAEETLEQLKTTLAANLIYYEEVYVPETFNYTYRDQDTREWIEEVDAPTEDEIALARAEVAVVEANLIEAQNLLAALKGEEVPEDATGSKLVQLEQALLEIENIEESIEATQLITSLSGIVTSLNAQVPDQVTQNPILIIAAVTPHTLEVYFDESDWGKIRVGYEVEVIFDALPEKTFVGQVVHVDPALANEQNTVVVRGLIELDISTTGWNDLPFNSAASVDVIGGRAENVVTVPVEALREISDGEYAVFVLENGELEMRMVEVGLQDLLYAEIVSGLEVGDVVTTGQVETE